MHAFDDIRITTPRLVLRPHGPQDAQGLFDIFSDKLATRYLARAAWLSLEQAQAFIAEDAVARREGKILRLAVDLADGPGAIGQCLLFNFQQPSRRAEIGYALAPRHWGRGYMNEALRAVVDFAFGQLALNRLEADIDPRNEASARTLDRLGFRLEGRLRERWLVNGEVSDSCLYGLLAREWPPAASAG